MELEGGPWNRRNVLTSLHHEAQRVVRSATCYTALAVHLTHQVPQCHRDFTWKRQVPKGKDLVGCASRCREGVRRQVPNRADHVVVTHEDSGPLRVDGGMSACRQMKRAKLACTARTMKANAIVTKNAPTNPSTVFFGLNLMS